MPDLSSELNLALAVGTDDTRDYLRGGSPSLRTSLLILDGLFNSTTGHTHNGAHQGGHLTFQDLVVGNNLNVTGASDLHGTVHAYSNLQVDGAATVGGALSANGGITATTLHATGAVTLDAAVGLGGGLTAAGSIRSDAYVAAGPGMAIGTGDLGANRGNNTGYLYLGNVSHYIGFDGTNYQLPTSNLVINGHQAATIDGTETFSNKTMVGGTLNSPVINSAALYSSSATNLTLAGTVTGQPAWASAQGFPQGTRIGGLLGVASRSADWVVDGGVAAFNGIGSGGTATQGINFNAAFGGPPKVVCTVQEWSGALGTIGQMNWEIQGITANGFTVAVYNTSGATQNCKISWMAIGS